MVVDVLVLFAKALKRSSAVFGPLHVGVHAVQGVGIAARRDKLHVVVARGGVVAALAVGCAAVRASVGSVPLDHQVVHVRVHRRNSQAQPPLVAAGNAILDL